MSTDNGDDILDGLESDGSILPIRPVQPSVAPAPSSSPPGPAWQPHSVHIQRAIGFAIGLVAAFALLVAFVLWTAWSERSPAPRVDGVALGRAFVKPLAGALADSLDGEAAAVESKTPVAKANADAKTDFRVRLNRAFAEANAEPFSKILPPETEPKDDAQRAEFVRLLRDFAKGLRNR